MNHTASARWGARWLGNPDDLKSGDQVLSSAVEMLQRPVFVVKYKNQQNITHEGTMIWGGQSIAPDAELPLDGFAPPLHPMDLGDSAFKADYGLKFAYIMGAMANGISSVDMVRAAGRAGMVGFFGAGGLSLDQVESAIVDLNDDSESFPVGFNLIHSPNDPNLEAALVDLYLKRNIRLVSASAYLGLTTPLVHYRVKGIYQTPQGTIHCPNRIIAKVSREEVARKFFAPPPDALLEELVRQDKITRTEANLARYIPVAQDMTAEADSGGHTDNRPALSLLPTIMAIRDQQSDKYDYQIPLRIGLGGGIATPQATAAAFSMGAAFVLTGSINQACLEADTSPIVKQMLSQAQQADVVMAPAGDMFELGAKVQVLKRGTMFAMRAMKLYDFYRSCSGFNDIAPQEQVWIEQELLKSTYIKAWENTRRYFEQRNPSYIAKAERNPKFKMALVFRSYLGLASVWAKTGDPSRPIDYQIWCGPAMGAFNAWVKGSFLEEPENRHVDVIALNLLYGACSIIRRQWLEQQRVKMPRIVGLFRPLEMAVLKERLKL